MPGMRYVTSLYCFCYYYIILFYIMYNVVFSSPYFNQLLYWSTLVPFLTDANDRYVCTHPPCLPVVRPYIYVYLNSSLLATFYTLSFLDYILEATHLLTLLRLLTLLINLRYSRYFAYSRYLRYSLTSLTQLTLSLSLSLSLSIYIYIYIYIYIHIYAPTHSINRDSFQYKTFGGFAKQKKQITL
jgi:hypothetical protein